MREARFEDFSTCIGEDFNVESADGAWLLKLEEAEVLPASVREAGAFRLMFRGPADPVLPQAIYRFRRNEDEFDIFIVPVERNQTGTGYEAIFS